MDHFHISDHVKKIVQNYIGEIQLRFTVDNKTTAWQKLEKRKVTGCTISTNILIMSMDIITMVAEREKRSPKTDSGFFYEQQDDSWIMDDLSVTTSFHIQTK